MPITGRSGQQYRGTEGANRCQQCQPAGSKIPRFSAIRVSLHYILHQAISPADLAAQKWRRLIYENMESALIRGNNSWMGPLLPKINPNATSGSALTLGFRLQAGCACPIRQRILYVQNCGALRSTMEMASMDAAMRTQCSGNSRIEPEQQAAGRLPGGT